jgi:hypothetical protein
VVHRVWKQNYDQIRRSLIQGYYQGWDLHPAQLPIRFAAVYIFFVESVDAAVARLRSYLDKAAQAGLAGQMFDDAASAQGLLNYFARGIECGALTEEDLRATGLSVAEIRSRSFQKIMQRRS